MWVWDSGKKCIVLQALYKSAELKAAQLKDTVKFLSQDQQKLMERLTAAQEQYNSGYSKLKATAKQLASLESTVNSPCC